MRDLIVKLETLKDSKEWGKIVDELKETMVERNELLLSGEINPTPHTEGDLIRHEIRFIDELIGRVTVKDKDCKQALIDDLNKSKNWRIDRILGRTHEYQLDSYIDGEYKDSDLTRAENWWIECFSNLPNKLVEELKVREVQVEELKDAEVQEQIDALASLEADGL